MLQWHFQCSCIWAFRCSTSCILGELWQIFDQMAFANSLVHEPLAWAFWWEENQKVQTTPKATAPSIWSVGNTTHYGFLVQKNAIAPWEIQWSVLGFFSHGRSDFYSVWRANVGACIQRTPAGKCGAKSGIGCQVWVAFNTQISLASTHVRPAWKVGQTTQLLYMRA